MLSFTYVYFLESSLLNGLRPIQTKFFSRLTSGRTTAGAPFSCTVAVSIHRNTIAKTSDFGNRKNHESVFPIRGRRHSSVPLRSRRNGSHPHSSPQARSASHDSRAPRHAAGVQPVSRLNAVPKALCVENPTESATAFKVRLGCKRNALALSTRRRRSHACGAIPPAIPHHLPGVVNAPGLAERIARWASEIAADAGR